MLTRYVLVVCCLGLLGAANGDEAAECNITLAPRASGLQVADEHFSPSVGEPEFDGQSGPTVYLDEAHNNFHTATGRYATFAQLLRQDGFQVISAQTPTSAELLEDADILVIANAMALENVEPVFDGRLPSYSAFSTIEISAIEKWVSSGGSLLLIADHMPFPGAAEQLAKAFGVHMTNSFATDASCADDEFLFDRKNGLLGEHTITEGRNNEERIDYVRSFTGQAFWLTVPGTPILSLGADSLVLLPSQAWVFDDQIPRVPGAGLLQGAVLRHGKGRVAVFGEAAMFTAQVSGRARRPMGMNMPSAAQNPQFLLNVMHWLAGRLPTELGPSVNTHTWKTNAPN